MDGVRALIQVDARRDGLAGGNLIDKSHSTTLAYDVISVLIRWFAYQLQYSHSVWHILWYVVVTCPLQLRAVELITSGSDALIPLYVQRHL